MAGARITVEEWRVALEAAMGHSDDAGMTTQELADAMGVSTRVALERLRKLAKAGTLRHGKRQTVGVSGRPAWTPVYWLKAE